MKVKCGLGEGDNQKIAGISECTDYFLGKFISSDLMRINVRIVFCCSNNLSWI